ncbi:MAG: DNA-binding protein YbiB [Betaproteobacteria bacterium]|nr:DNA-binding protein YbiB [Betaproteobacteria bacterium]
MDLAPIIKEIGRGAKGAKPLSENLAAALFGQMLDGQVPDLELGAILLSLRIKGEAAEEIAGFKKAMDARTTHIEVPHGPRCVVLPSYNGARRQANLMPLVASLLARRGVPVLIQGHHDFAERSNPFELLARLGVEACANPAAAAEQLGKHGLACIQLEKLNPGLAKLLSLRQRLGLRNTAHTLAKLLDPCPGRSVRVLALTHPEYFDRMSEQLQREAGHALLMRGTEGEAYAHPRRRPRLLGFFAGKPVELFAREEGSDLLREAGESGKITANAALITAMLDGTLPVPQPILDQVAALEQLAHA